MADRALSYQFTWDLHVLYGFRRGASVLSSCRWYLESQPMVKERGWGPAWVRLSWTKLRGADHRSEALKKGYKEGVSFPAGTAFSS